VLQLPRLNQDRTDFLVTPLQSLYNGGHEQPPLTSYLDGSSLDFLERMYYNCNKTDHLLRRFVSRG